MIPFLTVSDIVCSIAQILHYTQKKKYFPIVIMHLLNFLEASFLHL